MPRVQGTTLAPKGVTILLVWRQHMPGLPCVVLREQVGCPQTVAAGSETARRADVPPPLGFVTLQTGRPVRQRARTGLTGVGFIDQGDRDAGGGGLVGEILALAAMR